MESLFSLNTKASQPFAERMRPKDISQYIGQTHILAEGKPLSRMIANDTLSNIILWGPPGTGKTSLAHIVAEHTQKNFIRFSAVEHGVADLRKIVAFAKNELELKQKQSVVFVDELHRLNKSQQDAFLPHMEKGTFILIGATTENPSFAVNNALLSRSHVFLLQKLNDEELTTLYQKAKMILHRECSPEALKILLQYADGVASYIQSARGR